MNQGLVYLRVLLCVLALPGLFACVREYQEPVEKTVVWVTREKGQATVSWDAKPGTRYTLMYKDPSSSSWEVYPGAETVVGTGKRISFVDRSAKAPYRKYRAPALVEVPAK